MTAIVLPSFSNGEISPSLYGRTDSPLYRAALRRARNVVVDARGGVSNRAGLRFVGPVRDHDLGARLLPFRFSSDDRYVLEFGNYYMRVIRGGGHVLEAPKGIVSISHNTAEDTAQIEVEDSGYAVGDDLVVQGSSNPAINNRWFRVRSVDGDNIRVGLQVADETVNLGTTDVGGGTVSRVFEVTTPYRFQDLQDLTFAQDGDVITLTHPNYAIRELVRRTHSSWDINSVIELPAQGAPEVLGAEVVSAPGVGESGKEVRYAVTAVDQATGEESLTALSGDGYAITDISQSFPAKVQYDKLLVPVPTPVDTRKSVVLPEINFSEFFLGVSVTRGTSFVVKLFRAVADASAVTVGLQYENCSGDASVKIAENQEEVSFTVTAGGSIGAGYVRIASLSSGYAAGSARQFRFTVRSGTFVDATEWAEPALVS